MKPLLTLFAAAAMLLSTFTAGNVRAEDVVKVWTPPAHKIVAQTIIDKLMKERPELLSVTFHGVPPGADKDRFAMFAGSFLDRIGKASADDDIMVAAKGFTIIDPRWNKKDPEPKFLVLVPLRDAQSRNVGCIVFAFKNTKEFTKTEAEFLAAANGIRDSIRPMIADHASLFAPAS
ncbi:hypothetical protein ACFFWD_26090 [Bradyrhizobium erythrophlei]|uniref:hypothetical protein n=1 Tax=Bradyrhizobium erythrophlei TaxID=1437360 RepID=UPI0035EDD95B